jgi:excisionase family DNA binding protein
LTPSKLKLSNTCKPTQLEPRLLSPSAAATYLGISVWTARRMIWRGDLPSVRVGRLVRIDKCDLEAYIAEQKSNNDEEGLGARQRCQAHYASSRNLGRGDGSDTK